MTKAKTTPAEASSDATATEVTDAEALAIMGGEAPKGSTDNPLTEADAQADLNGQPRPRPDIADSMLPKGGGVDPAPGWPFPESEHTPSREEAREMFAANHGLWSVLTTEGNMTRDDL